MADAAEVTFTAVLPIQMFSIKGKTRKALHPCSSHPHYLYKATSFVLKTLTRIAITMDMKQHQPSSKA
jgi:hypothetical protein